MKQQVAVRKYVAKDVRGTNRRAVNTFKQWFSGGMIMVKSYCTYGMCNEDTAQTVNEGENLDRLTYWDGGKKVTVEDVHIISINKDTVTLELPDTEMILDIADVEYWE